MITFRELITRIQALLREADYIAPGSRIEHEVARLLTRFLDALPRVSYSVLGLNVKSWKPIKAHVHACGNTFEASLWPGCEPREYELSAPLVSLKEALGSPGSLQGYAVISPLLEEAVIRSLYSKLSTRHISLLILYGSNRRLALTTAPYTYTNLCADGAPVIHVDHRTAKSLKGCGRIRIEVSDRRDLMESPLIEAWSRQRGASLLITASLDALASPIRHGYTLLAALLLFKELVSSGKSVRLVMLPGGEIGDPVHPGYLPGYGAREYSAVMRNTPLGDEVVTVIGFEDLNGTSSFDEKVLVEKYPGERLGTSLWGTSIPFMVNGFPLVRVIAHIDHGPEEAMGRAVENIMSYLDWRSTVEDCTAYFYGKALRLRAPRIQGMVYKLRRLAEKAIHDNDYVKGIAACRVLIEAVYRLAYTVRANNDFLDLVSFYPLECIERGYASCVDVRGEGFSGLSRKSTEARRYLERVTANRIEDILEEYYVRGLLEKGSL